MEVGPDTWTRRIDIDHNTNVAMDVFGWAMHRDVPCNDSGLIRSWAVVLNTKMSQG